ncbi:MAG: hypothetical protein NC086_07385 [Alistipes sp.]|nr:hypothetical protein [Alistipes sp.]
MRNNNWNVRKRLEYELSDIVSDEGKLKEIISLAKREQKNKKEGKSIRTVWKVAIIAAALTLVSVGAVLGQEYLSRLYKTVWSRKYQDHLNQAESNAPVYDIETSKTEEAFEANEGNLTVEWGKYAATSHEAYISVTIKSKDGSPILEESENSVPINISAKFDAVYVTMDGETKKYLSNYWYGADDSTLTHGQYNEKSGVDCMPFPVGISEDLSSVTFELQYSNYDVELEGKEIEFAVENFRINYCNFEEIGAKITVADLLEGKVSGEDKIYFSDKYPDCYIDSFGFDSEEEFLGGKDFFYMTVVCDEASKEDMLRLAFQNTVTGLDGGYTKEELDDGRVLVKYVASRDGAYDEITHGAINPIDTTEEHLTYLILKMRTEIEEKRIEGTWSKAFVLKTEPVKIDEICEVEVPAVNNVTGSFVVNHVKVDGMELSLTGTTAEDHDFIKFDVERHTPVCTMKDGTSLILQFNGGGGNDITHRAGTVISSRML